MRPDISSAFRQAVNAQATSEGVYILVTIAHDDLDEVHYLTNAGANIVSRGKTFLAIPITPTLSEDSDERPPQAKLVMANIDRRLVAALRSTNKPCNVNLELIRAAAPDYVEAALTGFTMRDIDYNAMTIEGTLSLEGLFDEPAIDYCFTPTIAPGLFS